MNGLATALTSKNMRGRDKNKILVGPWQENWVSWPCLICQANVWQILSPDLRIFPYGFFHISRGWVWMHWPTQRNKTGGWLGGLLSKFPHTKSRKAVWVVAKQIVLLLFILLLEERTSLFPPLRWYSISHCMLVECVPFTSGVRGSLEDGGKAWNGIKPKFQCETCFEKWL